MSFSFALIADVQHADKVQDCQEYTSSTCKRQQLLNVPRQHAEIFTLPPPPPPPRPPSFPAPSIRDFRFCQVLAYSVAPVCCRRRMTRILRVAHNTCDPRPAN